MIYKETNFDLALPVWVKDDDKNLTLAFFTRVEKSDSACLRLTGQSTYEVFINGKFIFHGPSRAGRGFFRVDELDISNHLDKGENDITVLVSGYSCSSFYLMNQRSFLCAEIVSGDRVICATGKHGWSAHSYKQKLQRVERYAYQRPFAEVYDFTHDMPLALGDELALSVLDITSFICREVSYPDFDFEEHTSVIEAGNVQFLDTPRTFSPWWYDRIGRDCDGFTPSELTVNSSALACSLDTIASEDMPRNLRLNADTYATVSMKCNLTGLVKCELLATSDTTLLLTFDEVLRDGKVDFARGECVNCLIFKLSAGKRYTLLTAEPYTFKCMSVFSLGGSVEIDSLGIIRMDFNEGEIIKSLRPDADEQIKRIYEAGVETFRQNAFDIFMDCPSRERAGWLCDSFFTSRVEHLMSGKSTVEHAFLSNFMMEKEYLYLPSGMIPMCYPADHKDGNYIPNWAMWYVLELREYLKRTGDVSFVSSVKDKIYALCDFFAGFENESGLLCHLEGWVFVEWSECNNLTQDINYPTNMLYYMFKNAVYELYGDIRFKNEAQALRNTIRQRSKGELFFYENDIIDSDGVATLSGKVTETCQYYAFYTGVATVSEDTELWNVLVRDFGSERKRNNKYPDVYFSNAFIGNYLRLDLLKNAELYDTLERDIRGYFDYMALETGTLWENDTSSASCNHGFASHVLVWLDDLGYLI